MLLDSRLQPHLPGLEHRSPRAVAGVIYLVLDGSAFTKSYLFPSLTGLKPNPQTLACDAMKLFPLARRDKTKRRLFK